MSAAVAWDVAFAPGDAPARPARPQLVSVPCGDQARTPDVRIRLTRAGRLAITMAVAVAILAVALATFSEGASATVIDHSTAVRSGQTLSQIAAEQLPQLSITDAVGRIEVANNLTSSDIHAGQTLLIPAVR